LDCCVWLRERAETRSRGFIPFCRLAHMHKHAQTSRNSTPQLLHESTCELRSTTKYKLSSCCYRCSELQCLTRSVFPISTSWFSGRKGRGGGGRLTICVYCPSRQLAACITIYAEGRNVRNEKTPRKRTTETYQDRVRYALLVSLFLVYLGQKLESSRTGKVRAWSR
jgi:hypothetical protein